jgi:aminoglycoside phosphotransferase
MTELVYHNPEKVHSYYLLIPAVGAGDYKVLLRQAGDFWTLPVFQPKEHHFAVVKHINDNVRETLGLGVAALRCFHTDHDEEFGERRFYAMDNLDANWQLPSGYRWMSEEDLKTATLPSQLQRLVLSKWFDWRHSDHSLRAEWMRPGWFSKVGDWMADLADRMAMNNIGKPEQMRVWARSAAIRLVTGDGTLYLKAVPSAFSYEPVITRVLSIRYPNQTPDVRAVHVDNGWMLMRDFGGKSLSQIDDIDVWKKAVRQFAKMQMDMVGNTQSLVALGVPDRNVDYLSSQIDRLMVDLPDTLSHIEKVDLRRIASTLKAMAMELVEFNVPLSITHGDFWSGNTIIRDDGGCLFFDWSDASISHPFFDMPFFLNEIEAELPHVADAREQILTAYLENWTRYEPMANLRHAYDLAKVLGYLHQALFYHAHIFPNIESHVRWEVQNMLPHLLRHVLAAMKVENK